MPKSYRTEHLTISGGNTKMGLVASASVSPVSTCSPRCRMPGGCGYVRPGCKLPDCYACKMCRLYSSVARSYAKNTDAIRDVPFQSLALEIANFLRRHTEYRLFRWNVSGDIFSQNYAALIRLVAEQCPDVRFFAFTKRYDIAKKCFSDRPENLTIVLSAWNDVFQPSEELKRIFPVAHFRDGLHDDLIPSDAQECGGDCETCGLCAALKPGQSVFFNKH